MENTLTILVGLHANVLGVFDIHLEVVVMNDIRLRKDLGHSHIDRAGSIIARCGFEVDGQSAVLN